MQAWYLNAYSGHYSGSDSGPDFYGYDQPGLDKNAKYKVQYYFPVTHEFDNRNLPTN